MSREDSLSPEQFLEELGLLDPKDREAFAAANINSFLLGNSFLNYYLNRIVWLIPEDLRASFLQRDDIQSLISKVDNPATLLITLPPNSQVAFAERWVHLITDKLELIKLIDSLNADYRLTFAESDKGIARILEIHEGISSVLNRLPEASHFHFAVCCLPKLKNEGQLIELLKALPEGELKKSFTQREDFQANFQAKIKNGNQLRSMLLLLPEASRVACAVHCRAYISNPQAQFRGILSDKQIKTFVTDYLAAAPNGHELARALSWMDPSLRAAAVEPHLNKIQTVIELSLVMDRVSDFKIQPIVVNDAEDRDALMHRRADYTAKIDALMHRADYTAKIEELFAKTSDWSDCDILFRYMPKSSKANFVLRLKDKIKTEQDFLGIFSLSEFMNASFAQKNSFVEGCTIKPSAATLLSLKIYSRSLFDDPIAQQMFALNSLDPNVFLFAAASDPSREDNFDYFLTNPLCSPNSLNESAKTLIMHINEQQDLSDELKASRVAKVIAQLDLKRKQTAAGNLGFNLSSLKQAELKFEGSLPVVAAEEWPELLLDPARIQRFRQLIQWLKAEPALAAYQANFAALESNTLIRVSAEIFNSTADDLESFVATLALYLAQRKAPLNETDRLAEARALASHIDASEQLLVCEEGVRSSLLSMTRSLNPGISLVNAVDIAMDRAIGAFVRQVGIPEDMEVHASKDRLLSQLGMDSRIHYDRFRLAISPIYLQAIAKNAAGCLTPDFIISQSLPQLESMQESQSLVFNGALINALERDWYLLYTSGLLTEERTLSSDKCFDVMRFIDSRLSEEEARAIIAEHNEKFNITQVIGRDLTVKVLTADYRDLLERTGILTMKLAVFDQMQAAIWSMLTSEEADLSHYDEFLQRILNAPNGVAWVKAVIESHGEAERATIQLKVLLHSPKGSSESLFRALVCDPYSAAWLRGWEIRREGKGEGARISFKPSDCHYLAEVLKGFGRDEDLMHREMDEILVRPGNLLFWLGELHEDTTRISIFKDVFAFVTARGLYRFDSLLGVMSEMLNKGDPTEQGVALSFLEYHCEQQKIHNQWSCYWKTACYLNNVELKFDSKEMLQSLKDPKNARAALFIAKTNQNLVLKITQALATMPELREDYAAVLSTIASLFPATTPDRDAGAGSDMPSSGMSH